MYHWWFGAWQPNALGQHLLFIVWEMCHVSSFEPNGTFTIKCVSEGLFPISFQSKWKLYHFQLPSNDWPQYGRNHSNVYVGKKKNEHKVFSHRVRAECKPPKCFILRHTCLPWLVGNPVNVGMTSSVHCCSAVTAGHCNDLSLNVFLRHVPHVTANYAGVKEASKHSSLNVMALVQFYFIKLLQYKTEVKQFFWGLELLCS